MCVFIRYDADQLYLFLFLLEVVFMIATCLDGILQISTMFICYSILFQNIFGQLKDIRI